MSEKFTRSYTFSNTELKKLAYLFRHNPAIFGYDLEKFQFFLNEYIYDTMTIEEAEIFFNEK